MAKEEMVIVKEYVDEEIQYKCSEDGTVIWVEYDNGVQIHGSDCKHFKWEWAGNGCYPDQLDPEICSGIEDIVNESIKKIWEGTTVWFLVPKK